MELKLSVPPLSTRLLTEVEMRPPRVKAWLESLPLLNIVETGNKLFSSLSIYNRIAIKPAERVELLEMFRYTVRQLSIELEKQYLGLSLPLSEKHKNIAERNRQFHLEMAIGYKRALLDCQTPDKPVESEKQRNEQARITERAIRYLTNALAVSYQTYSPHPLGTWQEIHALYRHAEALGIADLPTEDFDNPALPSTSAGQVYRQALLLDLSDPYHQPGRMVNRIYQYLNRWAGLARVLPASTQFDPTCQFLIDQGEDRSGIIYTSDVKFEQPERYRLLNTVELARMIHTQLTAMQRRETVSTDGLDPDFFNTDAPDLLLRLIHTWGAHPKRLFRRNARSGARVELAVGLSAANYWLNGGSKFSVSSTFVGPMPQRTQLGAATGKRREETSPDFEYTGWDVADESAGGMALTKRGAIFTRVRVGEVVVVRVAGEQAWRIGVIRWAKSAASSSVEIGLQWLAPRAEAVVIKIMTDEGRESDFMPAVLLPMVAALKQPATLLTPRGVFRPQRKIYMDNGYRLYPVVITHSYEISQSFERFQFEIPTD
jgi:cyclic-di-GMP-binding protein